MAELNTRIIIRNDSTANWNSNETTVMLKGEFGVEFNPEATSTGKKVKVKIGDGVNTWKDLPYFGGEESKTFQVSSLDEITETDLAVGDTAIVKTPIYVDEEDETKSKYSYTGYVYNGTTWAAMDGNYNASNVILGNDITLAGNYTSIGNYNKGDTIAAGSSLESILSALLQQEIMPGDTGYAIDLPSASISVSGGTGEVGSSYTLPTATLTITDVGSYPFEPKATGIVFAAGDVTLSGGGSAEVSNDTQFVANSKLTLQATDTETLYTDTSKSYTFSGTASYQASTVTPKSNLGNEVPAKKIGAGSVTVGGTKTATFSGYRYIFAGGTTASTIDSTVIRALTKKKKSSDAVVTASGDNGIVFTAAKGDVKAVFAYPSTWTSKTPKFELFTMSWGATEGFEKSTVQVADYRGGENGLKEYTVYTFTPATPFAADETKYSVHFE